MEISGHGRFNPTGVQVLYLADSPETSTLEIGLEGESENIAEVGEFITLDELRLWDTRNLDKIYQL